LQRTCSQTSSSSTLTMKATITRYYHTSLLRYCAMTMILELAWLVSLGFHFASLCNPSHGHSWKQDYSDARLRWGSLTSSCSCTFCRFRMFIWRLFPPSLYFILLVCPCYTLLCPLPFIFILLTCLYYTLLLFFPSFSLPHITCFTSSFVLMLLSCPSHM